MKAIILVGGEGTRLRPLTYSIVKSMVPVLNRPFMEHVIRKLAKHGIKEAVLAMGYKPDSIYEYFQNVTGLDIKLTYSLEEKPLGTAGAVKHAAQHVEDTFFVLNGDTFSDIDYTEMLQLHRRNKARATIALTRVEDPTIFGVVETDRSGRVKAFIEKPARDKVTSHWINAGIYILEPEVLDYIPENEFYMFERGVFPCMLASGERVYAYKSKAYWIDMGTPAKYHQLNRDLLQGKCSTAIQIPGAISIGDGSKIHPGARLTAPVMIDRDCIIDEEVELRGPVVIGTGCHIHRKAVVDNSILWENIIAGAEAVIFNSVIASGAKIKEKALLHGETINHVAPDAPGKK